MSQTSQAADLRGLLEPQSIAIVGASDQEGNAGGRAVSLLQKFGYAGKIWPVNPGHKTVAGLPCYDSVAALPGKSDLAIIAVDETAVLSAVQACAKAGLKNGVVWAADGAALRGALAQESAQSGFRVCGPDSTGIVNTHLSMAGSRASGLTRIDTLFKGAVSFVSQSGSVASSLLALAQHDGFGFRYLIDCGQEADLTAADFIAALVDDKQTKVIAAYVNSVADGPAFIAALAKARAARKPVVMLRTGRARGDEAADQAFDAVLREQAVIPVASHYELLSVSLYLANTDYAKLPKGRNIAIIGFGGGSGVMTTDLCGRWNLQVPSLSRETLDAVKPLAPPIAALGNPIDLTPEMHQAKYVANFVSILDGIANDPQIDIAYLSVGVGARPPADMARDILQFRDRCKKTLVISWSHAPKSGVDALAQAGIPYFKEPIDVVSSMSRVCDHVEAMNHPALGRAVSGAAVDWKALTSVKGGAVADADLRKVADAMGLRFAEGKGGQLQLRVTAYRDRIFGPMLTVGVGGALVGLMNDQTVERAPVDKAAARQMLQRLHLVQRVNKLDPTADIDKFADVLSTVSRHAAAAPWKRFTLTLDPLASENGAPAVVALSLTIDEA